MKLKLIKYAFHLKNTSYSNSIDRTIEERNSYKALLNQKKELEKEVFCTNADNMINKRNEIQSLVSTNNPDVCCITETLPKNVLLKIEECGIQIDGYDCFSNLNNSNCHRGFAIYTKKYLNARSYLTNVKDFQEHACCKTEWSDKALYIFCVYIDHQTVHLKIRNFSIS